MKKFFVLIVVVLAINFSNVALAQTKEKEPLVKSIDLGVGYVPKSDVEAFRASVAFTNLAFKRFGLYTAYEKNFNTDYNSHLIGITGSINHFVYLYAGMDFFTKETGLFSNNGFDGTRKDFGVGVYPMKWALVKVGYSFSVGPLAEIGVHIPLN